MNRKKMKFNVGDLKVQSFVTSLNNEEKFSLNGGSGDYPTTGQTVETIKVCTCYYSCGSGACSQSGFACC